MNATAQHTDTDTDHDLLNYDDAIAHVRERFARLTINGPLFTTNATNLWETYLSGIPADRRQHYTCRACQQFIEGFGGLAIVDNGRLVSPLWSTDPNTTSAGVYVDDLGTSFRDLAKQVARAKITGVFVAKTPELGTAQTIADHTLHVWSHFHAQAPAYCVNRSKTKTTAQVMAEKREEYQMLSRSFGDFSLATVQRAHELLSSGQLYRSEKCEGVAKWLHGLYVARANARADARDIETWLAVAGAPAGWCHVRSGMIGTLLEDVQAGLPFAEIKARFDAKMHPLQYQRPTAPPSAGNIAQAEKLVEQLRTAGALERRFARLDEVDALWKPAAPAKTEERGGVFGHLLLAPQRATYQPLPPVTMTWVKFRDTVLPSAASIEYQVPGGAGPYCAITTAVHADAPPILQWDREEKRNPTSWYVYVNGSQPSRWNLRAGDWTKVNALALRPCHWYGNVAPNNGQGLFVALDGARDTGHVASGGFFVENLRSEYHSVRRTLEAYALRAAIAGNNEATACGLMLQGGERWTGVMLRVTTTTGSVALYNLDRWD